MVTIEEDRWHDKIYNVNGKSLARKGSGSFKFFIDEESGKLYCDYNCQSISLKDFNEFYLTINKTLK